MPLSNYIKPESSSLNLIRTNKPVKTITKPSKLKQKLKISLPKSEVIVTTEEYDLFAAAEDYLKSSAPSTEDSDSNSDDKLEYKCFAAPRKSTFGTGVSNRNDALRNFFIGREKAHLEKNQLPNTKESLKKLFQPYLYSDNQFETIVPKTLKLPTFSSHSSSNLSFDNSIDTENHLLDPFKLVSNEILGEDF